MSMQDSWRQHRGTVGKLVLAALALTIIWYFWLRTETPKHEAPPTANKTSVDKDADELLASRKAPKAPAPAIAPDPIIITQVVVQVVEKTTTVTNTIEVSDAMAAYEHCDGEETTRGKRVETYTNAQGKVLTAPVTVTKVTHMKRGYGPNAPTTPTVIIVTSPAPQVIVLTNTVIKTAGAVQASTVVPTSSAQPAQVVVPTGMPPGYWSNPNANPFAKPETGGEAFYIRGKNNKR